MTTEALKTTAITNLDATPAVRPSTGKGGQAFVRQIDGVITVTDGATSPSTYQMARVPSNAIIKDIKIAVDATVTTLTCDIGGYYPTGGPLPSGIAAGTVIDQDFFGSAVDLKTKTSGPVSQMNESGTYTAAKRLQPLWQAIGLTSDPKCDIDIVLTTTATNSGAAVIYTSVEYTLPM